MKQGIFRAKLTALLSGPVAVAMIGAAGMFASPADLSAQTSPRPGADAKPVVENARPLQFEKSTVSFGDIRQGDSVDITFPFTNTGDKTVRITNVHTGCGCTAAKNNPSEVKPGESADITVSFNSKGRSGKQNRTISVYTDGGQSPYQLTFDGIVVVDLYLSDQRLDFGDIEAGTEAKKQFSLINLGAETFNVKSVNVALEGLSVKELEQKPIEQSGRKGTEYVFEVTVPSDFPVQNFNERVRIETDSTDQPYHGLMLRGNVIGDVSVTPVRLYAIMNTNDEMEKSIQLVSRSKTPFKVTKYDIQSKGGQEVNVDFSVSDADQGIGKVVTASFAAGDQPQNVNADLTVQIELADGKTETLRIPIVQVVRNSPKRASDAQQRNVPQKATKAQAYRANARQTLKGGGLTVDSTDAKADAMAKRAEAKAKAKGTQKEGEKGS